MGIDDQAFRTFFQDNSVRDLEQRVRSFNLFEALGMQRKERRHTHFLAYILDENRPHGLGDGFLRGFLYEALTDIDSRHVVPADMMTLVLDPTSVVPDGLSNIDILITLNGAKVVVAIENKIDADETDNQLSRYHQWVENEFPTEWRKVYLYVTPTGAEPSHAEWRPISYSVVVETLKEFESSATTSDVRLALPPLAYALDCQTNVPSLTA